MRRGHSYTIKFCADCGNAKGKNHREVCPARIEAKGRPGYVPDGGRRQLSESEHLARRWGVAAAQSGFGEKPLSDAEVHHTHRRSAQKYRGVLSAP